MQTNLSFSHLSEGVKHPLNYSQTNLPPYIPSRSKDNNRDKSMERSRDSRVVSYKDLGKSIRTTSYNGIDHSTYRDLGKLDFK